MYDSRDMRESIIQQYRFEKTSKWYHRRGTRIIITVYGIRKITFEGLKIFVRYYVVVV